MVVKTQKNVLGQVFRRVWFDAVPQEELTDVHAVPLVEVLEGLLSFYLFSSQQVVWLLTPCAF